MADTPNAIAPSDRTLAALTHMSGLSGYFVPLGGIVVPILIWIIKKDSPTIATIAKQAIFLNVVFFFLVGVTAVLWLTLFWTALWLAAIALPIIGAIKASDGTYYRYPGIGLGLN
jgi:uncharacterized Tic20 family protein